LPLRPKPISTSGLVPEPVSVSGGGYQYGVTNPDFFAGTPTPTEGYGPNDFIVETVKLDKAFFHQVTRIDKGRQIDRKVDRKIDGHRERER
jgi:hypothetical protein